MTNAERIGEAELNAYVDGQLDTAGRVEVEDHLARNPEIAARVMADLGMRDALRLAFPLEPADAPDRTIAAARRLENALGFRRALVPLRRLAAGIVIFALGWAASLGWNEISRPADQTALLARAAKLAEAVDVRLPRVPVGWTLVDAAMTRTQNCPGVKLSFDTPEFGPLSLVATDTRDVAIEFPTVRTKRHSSTVHWQMVSDRYDMTANLARRPAELAALELYQTLY
jgi:hypothetical protein